MSAYDSIRQGLNEALAFSDGQQIGATVRQVAMSFTTRIVRNDPSREQTDDACNALSPQAPNGSWRLD